MARFRKIQLQQSYADQLGFKSTAAYVCDDDTTGKVYESLPTGGVMIESFGESFEGYLDGPFAAPVVHSSSKSVVTEAKTIERVRHHMKRAKCSWKEASIFVAGEYIPEPGNKKDELREAWRRYAPVLRESEIDVLIQKNIPVPEN